MLTLTVEKRAERGKAARQLRESGKMPAVLYGPKQETIPITVSERDFVKIWNEAGESTVIELAGEGDNKEALIHEVDVDPVSGKVRHADFYIFEKGKTIQVDVPLEFVGEAPVVKEQGSTLVKVLHELEIEVMPRDLPHNIPVDVSKLTDIDSQIHVRDLKLSEAVTVLTSPDEVVAAVALVKEEEEITEEAPDLESIEVEQRGKKEEGESTEGEQKEEQKNKD